MIMIYRMLFNPFITFAIGYIIGYVKGRCKDV